MRTLLPPKHDALADVRTWIESEKQPEAKERLEGAAGRMAALFAAYDDRGWDFETLVQQNDFDEHTLSALLNTYKLTYAKQPLSGLRDKIIATAEGLCPYCGIAWPGTLDHFLPKSEYQPFAAYVRNLAPMCATCNTYKGTKGDAEHRQFFVHAYFDELDRDKAFLKAQVIFGKKHIATNFTIFAPWDMDAEIFQRLAYQFSVLRLAERYQREAVALIAAQAEEIDKLKAERCKKQELRFYIHEEAEVRRKKWGENYWETALLRALAGSVAFMNDGYKLALTNGVEL